MTSTITLSGILMSPETRHTQNGIPITTATIETTSTNPNDPPFQVNLKWFGEYGMTAMQSFRDGDRVVVIGRLEIDKITQGDRNRYETSVRVQSLLAVDQLALPVTTPAPREAAPSQSGSDAARTGDGPGRAPIRQPAKAIAAGDEPEYSDIPF